MWEQLVMCAVTTTHVKMHDVVDSVVSVKQQIQKLNSESLIQAAKPVEIKQHKYWAGLLKVYIGDPLEEIK